MIRPACLAVLALASPAAASPLDIVYQPLFDPTPQQSKVLDDGEYFWEYYLPGYRRDIAIPEVSIDISAYDIDGPGATLAEATYLDTVEQGGVTLPTTGFIGFDLADVDPLERDGGIYPVLLHETAHALGFGTLWEANDLYEPGSGAYTGRSGLGAYRNEFDPLADHVPVELSSGPATDDAHWAFDWAGPYDDLMTGALFDTTSFSRTTLAAFRDLGYDPVPVPLPAALWLALAALGGLALSARTRPRSSA